MKQGVKYSITEEQLQEQMNHYVECGGDVCVLDDGSLRTGTVVMYGGNKMWAYVSYEVYLNSWSSDQVIIKYHPKKLPKKWLKVFNENYDKAA